MTQRSRCWLDKDNERCVQNIANVSVMTAKYSIGEGTDTITTDRGMKFDYYYSTVTEDAFDRYSNFIYLIIKRVDAPDTPLIKRHAYLVPFTLLNEFLTTVSLPGEKIVHIEPITIEMVGFTRDELKKDHVVTDSDIPTPDTPTTRLGI